MTKLKAWAKKYAIHILLVIAVLFITAQNLDWNSVSYHLNEIFLMVNPYTVAAVLLTIVLIIMSMQLFKISKQLRFYEERFGKIEETLKDIPTSSKVPTISEK